jgi:lipopolysaccharide transport system permease protein
MSSAAGWLGLLALFRSRVSLIRSLITRDITARYRGSVLGVLWSLVTPLCMLAIYSFVFGSILGTRWNGGNEQAGMAGFAIILFVGLIIFHFFSEVVTRAPTLVLSNVNYVKKVVFPLEILPVVAVGSALFHLSVSLVALLTFMLWIMGHIPPTAALLPIVLAPFVLVILGLGWLFASLGVYLRDITQILGPLVTALMFLSPTFFPSSALPEWIRPWLVLNPLTLPIEQARTVLIWGNAPDWTALGLYGLFAAAIAAAGFCWFQATRKGFADVL